MAEEFSEKVETTLSEMESAEREAAAETEGETHEAAWSIEKPSEAVEAAAWSIEKPAESEEAAWSIEKPSESDKADAAWKIESASDDDTSEASTEEE